MSKNRLNRCRLIAGVSDAPSGALVSFVVQKNGRIRIKPVVSKRKSN
jgi:hypothetical protein